MYELLAVEEDGTIACSSVVPSKNAALLVLAFMKELPDVRHITVSKGSDTVRYACISGSWERRPA